MISQRNILSNKVWTEILKVSYILSRRTRAKTMHWAFITLNTMPSQDMEQVHASNGYTYKSAHSPTVIVYMYVHRHGTCTFYCT